VKPALRGSPHEHEHEHADGTRHTHTHDHPYVPAGTLHYGQGPARAHAPGLSQARMVRIEQDILGKNDAYARANRERLVGQAILALNLVSAPGRARPPAHLEP
jgi:hydrogenase nickel incorporation protein HypB